MDMLLAWVTLAVIVVGVGTFLFLRWRQTRATADRVRREFDSQDEDDRIIERHRRQK